MGVLACGRRDCKEIMCDRLILDSSMYICNDCFHELVRHKEERMPTTGINKENIRQFIVDFMDTVPGTYLPLPNQEEIEQEFQRLTGQNYDD